MKIKTLSLMKTATLLSLISLALLALPTGAPAAGTNVALSQLPEAMAATPGDKVILITPGTDYQISLTNLLKTVADSVEAKHSTNSDLAAMASQAVHSTNSDLATLASQATHATNADTAAAVAAGVTNQWMMDSTNAAAAATNLNALKLIGIVTSDDTRALTLTNAANTLGGNGSALLGVLKTNLSGLTNSTLTGNTYFNALSVPPGTPGGTNPPYFFLNNRWDWIDVWGCPTNGVNGRFLYVSNATVAAHTAIFFQNTNLAYWMAISDSEINRDDEVLILTNGAPWPPTEDFASVFCTHNASSGAGWTNPGWKFGWENITNVPGMYSHVGTFLELSNAVIRPSSVAPGFWAPSSPLVSLIPQTNTSGRIALLYAVATFTANSGSGSAAWDLCVVSGSVTNYHTAGCYVPPDDIGVLAWSGILLAPGDRWFFAGAANSTYTFGTFDNGALGSPRSFYRYQRDSASPWYNAYIP